MHIESFTVPGRSTPWIYDSRKRILRILVPISRWDGANSPVRLRIRGEPDKPRITVWTYYSSMNDVIKWVKKVVRADLDYNEFIARTETFPQLRKIAEKYRGLRPGRCTGLYEALLSVIVRQRISLKAANKIMARLVELLGFREKYNGETYYWYPTPETIIMVGEEVLRKVPLPRMKARAMMEISVAELEGRIPHVETAVKYPEKTVEALQELYGVGPWTARLAVAMVHPRFPLGPSTDLAVIRGMSLLIGKNLDSREVDRILSALGDYAGLAMYLAAFEYERAKSAPRV